MSRSFRRVLPFLILAFAACGKKPVATPAPANPQPPAAVAVEEAEEAPAAPTMTPYEGSWDGKADPDLPLNFTVEGNQVTYFFANYHGQSGTCSYNGAFSNKGPSAVTGNTFTAYGQTDNGPIEFNAAGTFTSPTEASGTIVWKGKSDLCGPFEIKSNWKAKKTPPPSDGY
jgi:hypothetical protein